MLIDAKEIIGGIMHLTMRQKELLKKLLINVRKNSDYYKEIFKNYGEINDAEIAFEMYTALKSMTKKDIISVIGSILSNKIKCGIDEKIIIEDMLDTDKLSQNHDRIIDIGGKKWNLEMTSGTSGMPFAVIKSNKEKILEGSYLLKQRRKIYCEASFRNSFMLIHSIDPNLWAISHRGFHDESFERILSYMESVKPKWMFCGVNLLTYFSEYIEKNNYWERVSNIGLKFIETTSQNVPPKEKEYFEKRFNTKLINNYSCREVWNLAYECPCGKMHINQEYLIIDIVDDDGKSVPEGVVGHVAITSLSNYAMPLIKYIIGDEAYLLNEKCLCGNTSPVLYLAPSRKYETIEESGENGTAIFRKILRRVYFHNKVRDIKGIKIIQDREWHFLILVNKINKEKNIEFEDIFKKQASLNLKDFKKYSFSFEYVEFEEQNGIEFEKIFKNVIVSCR